MSTKQISNFHGVYHFLSNFYETQITYMGFTFSSSEAAFQAAKCANPCDIPLFQTLSAGLSKKRGRAVTLRTDWAEVRDSVMWEVLQAKFDQNPQLKQSLMDTDGYELIEGNTWGDKYWGVCDGEGENKLGTLLMHLRDIYLGEHQCKLDADLN